MQCGGEFGGGCAKALKTPKPNCVRKTPEISKFICCAVVAWQYGLLRYRRAAVSKTSPRVCPPVGTASVIRVVDFICFPTFAKARSRKHCIFSGHQSWPIRGRQRVLPVQYGTWQTRRCSGGGKRLQLVAVTNNKRSVTNCDLSSSERLRYSAGIGVSAIEVWE